MVTESTNTTATLLMLVRVSEKYQQSVQFQLMYTFFGESMLQCMQEHQAFLKITGVIY